MPDLNDIDSLIEPQTCEQTDETNTNTTITSATNYNDDDNEKTLIRLVDQIETHFQMLKESLELRKNNLLDELKNTSDLNSFELLFGDLDLDKLIKCHGKIQHKQAENNLDNKNEISPNQVDCFLSGKGLKECTTNKTARFTLTFKNRALSKSNVSFLDIFIVATESNKKKSSISTINTTNISVTSSPTKNSSVRLRRMSSSVDSSQCNCDCKLEFISDGLYAVNYKLDKSGVYLLNILVNKLHVGESPYKLICYDLETKTIKPSKTVGSFHISPSSSSIFSSKSTFQSSLRHSITNENINSHNKKNNSDLNLPKSKYIKTNSMTQLNNLTNINKKTSLKSQPSQPPSTQSTLKTKLNKQNCFSFTNGIITKSSQSFSNLKDNSSILSSRVTSPFHSETKTSLISSQSNFEFSTLDKKEDDCLFQIGSRGRNSAEFLNPQAVCSTADYIYVSDSNNQKIDVFSHNGEFKFSLGNNLPNTSRVIRRPIGIKVTFDKKILVVDYEYKCVNVFEENGKFLNRICQSRLLGPKGICVNRFNQNQIIVADAKANSVCIFDSEGKFQTRFGNLGNKNENFAGPQYVACASNADIIVTDFYNHCIKIFDAFGHFKFSFGSNGVSHGQFNGPTGVAVDKNDNIIVADWGNSRIQVFDKHGEFIRFINSETNRLYGPQDLTLINNTIAVADSGNHCVKIFEYN